MKYWSRNDTKEWIVQLEHRIEDIDYYQRRRTVEREIKEATDRYRKMIKK